MGDEEDEEDEEASIALELERPVKKSYGIDGMDDDFINTSSPGAEYDEDDMSRMLKNDVGFWSKENSGLPSRPLPDELYMSGKEVGKSPWGGVASKADWGELPREEELPSLGAVKADDEEKMSGLRKSLMLRSCDVLAYGSLVKNAEDWGLLSTCMVAVTSLCTDYVFVSGRKHDEDRLYVEFAADKKQVQSSCGGEE